MEYIISTVIWTLLIEVVLFGLFTRKLAEYIGGLLTTALREKLGKERFDILEQWLNE